MRNPRPCAKCGLPENRHLPGDYVRRERTEPLRAVRSPLVSFYRIRMEPWDNALQGKAESWRPIIAAALAESAMLAGRGEVYGRVGED